MTKEGQEINLTWQGNQPGTKVTIPRAYGKWLNIYNPTDLLNIEGKAQPVTDVTTAFDQVFGAARFRRVNNVIPYFEIPKRNGGVVKELKVGILTLVYVDYDQDKGSGIMLFGQHRMSDPETYTRNLRDIINEANIWLDEYNSGVVIPNPPLIS